jgi:hypothetical protein
LYKQASRNFRMTKTFTNAILITSTAFVALMIVTPFGHLSAENQVTVDVAKKVHKATIESLETDSQSFVVKIEGLDISVTTNASTTITSSGGDPVDFSALHTGAVVYVFGYYDPVAKSIYTEKITICNKSKTGRTSLSRAQMKNQSNHPVSSPLSDLGLTLSQ